MTTKSIIVTIALIFNATFFVLKIDALSSCVKQTDCQQNQLCRYYDHSPDIPPMWPPCPHFGLCVCAENTALIGNGSCIPLVTLNLGERCNNSIMERYAVPELMYCDNGRVACNWPLMADENNQRCIATTTQSLSTISSIFQSSGSSGGINIFSTSRRVQNDDATLTPNNSSYANYLASCNPTKRLLCDQPRQGLCCLLKGPDANYQQCLCCDPHHAFDFTTNKCRLRIYGDLCTTNEDCNSGNLGTTGFECRSGRCRCSTNFEPIDAMYWNDTGKTTYMRRICVIQGAFIAVPTGQECTMNPHLWSRYNTTKICHRRAFCHQCFRERVSATDTYTQTVGMCRELICQGDSDCQLPMQCNKWGLMLDPPCERGMCDCDVTNSYYMDRFSRCSPYRSLRNGDRCLLKFPNGLHPWYQTNEDWDESRSCIELRSTRVGTIKCDLPNYEEVDGSCVPNNDTSGTLFVKRLFGEACDDSDSRQPRVICDTDKKLACFSGKCACAPDSSIKAANAIFWDGQTCRSKTWGDPCKTDIECLTGSYYPSKLVGARCYQEACSCAVNLTAADVKNVLFDNGAYTQTTIVSKFCFPPNITVVGKGGDCHLDPIGYAEDCLLLPTQIDGPTLICDASQGLTCIRCPADFNPDDEKLGICRNYNRLPFQPPANYYEQCNSNSRVGKASDVFTTFSSANDDSSSTTTEPTPQATVARQIAKNAANSPPPYVVPVRSFIIAGAAAILLSV